MAETGIARFPGSLDPRAEEFRPRNPSSPNQVILFGPPPPPPPPVYYPYGSPFPVPTISEVQVLPFGDVGLGYPQFSSTPGYVSTAAAAAVAVRVPAAATSAVSTRAVLLSSVPSEVSESLVRRELEAFGEVRGVQMERVCDGIVTVHFYDLRHAENALREIREQHMQQQNRLRNYHYMMTNTISTTTTTTNTIMLNSGPDHDPNWAASLLLPPVPPPARGLIAGRAVWAHFVVPATNSVPDGYNQGTIVIFNLDPEVTAFTLKDTFQAFGPIKELRETPSKKHQKFIEFYDVRDAAKALNEMNGKEINDKQVVIEFSRPGGQNRKIINAVTTSHKYTPSPAPPPVAPKFSGRVPSFKINVPPRSYAAQSQFSVKKPSYGKGSSNGNKGSSSSVLSVERKMASVDLGSSVCINGGNRDRDSSHGSSKRFTRKTQNDQESQASNHQSTPPNPLSPPEHQQAPAPRSRSRKGTRQGKKLDSRFLISEEAMTESNCRDTRTTVMIKNIPNKYSQKLLLNMLDNHCIHCNELNSGDDGGNDQPFSSYDFVYLPIDFNNKCNVGYGFVNMTSPEATWRLYKAFHLQHWEVFNSRKICEVTYARVQGLEALKEHFKNSKFPCEMDHYLPVVFSPPRDGRQLTEPLPIVGQNKQLQLSIISNGHDHDDEILDGQDDELLVENDNNADAFDSSNDDVSDLRHQVVHIGHDNSTGCSSCSLNGGVLSTEDE